MPEVDQVIRDRSVRLFTYLKEITELRTKAVRTVEQYDEVLWFSDIPREKGCRCAAWGITDEEADDGDVWIEIRKPRMKPPPKPPSELKPWLPVGGIGDSSRGEPVLKEQIVLQIPVGPMQENGDVQTVVHHLSEHVEIRRLWETYVLDQWRPWAEEDRRLQRVQNVYTRLYSAYQKQQRMGEAYEVITGLGYLTWQVSGAYAVGRHVVTAQTSLTFDARTGAIKVGPAGEGAKPALEQDMLDPTERPGPELQRSIEAQVSEIEDGIWEAAPVHSVLSSYAHALSSTGQFDNSIECQQTVTTEPRVYLAPALILRKRTERSLLRVLQEIIEQIREGKPVPIGVERIVTIRDDGNETNEDCFIDDRGGTVRDLLPDGVYFPLPTNEEQRRIAELASCRQGVLVQGPPGTGKSHTIANLVSHLLALGKRVLVTSHTARALKVLRGKLPEKTKHLCVNLLGDDLDALRSLEESVQGISDRYNAFDRKTAERELARLEHELGEARKAEASLLSSLRAVREKETYWHANLFDSYQGTAQQIAKQIRDQTERYAWVLAHVKETDESPLSTAEAGELLDLLRRIHPTIEDELGKAHLDLGCLPPPEEFRMLVRGEAEATTEHAAAEPHRNHPAYQRLRTLSREDRLRLRNGIEDFLVASQHLNQETRSWLRNASEAILSGRHRAWYELYQTTKTHIEALEALTKQIVGGEVPGLGNRPLSEVKAHATALIEHLKSGRGLGFWIFRPKVVRLGIYLIKTTKVSGRPCDTIDALQSILTLIDIEERLATLRLAWSQYEQIPTGPHNVCLAAYRDILFLLTRPFKLYDNVTTLRKTILGIGGLPEPRWVNEIEVSAFKNAVAAVDVDERLGEIRSRLIPLENELGNAAAALSTHSVNGRLLAAVRGRNSDGYHRHYQEVVELEQNRRDLRRRDDLLRGLTRSAPRLAIEIRQTPRDQIWDGRMAEFTAAWAWGRAHAWLQRMGDPLEQDRLVNHLDVQREHIRHLVEDLAACKAWSSCFTSRMKEEQRQHLLAWSEATRRVGKGTGKYANQHRRAARAHMEECRSAIPAWIMPIYRVAETIRPGTENFDVVIVDEASQSGPEALFLSYIGKKIIVVGDDKQISPEFVGLDREEVESLRMKHIPDLPHSDLLGVDSSLFTQAAVRYSGRIRLREHFRCMPEIIQFSNNLCYQAEPLVPLRQFGSGRLVPLITRYVPGGYQDGRSPRVINRPEAEALIDQVVKCCSDERYKDKTFGIISLLGEGQARIIEQVLLQRIGPEEMEKRALVCGDAYAFQGDERDVMFLSLVSAPTEGQRIGTLTKASDERRFNVAVSRAKDQVWLFHSATLNDLSPQCLRYKLLQYFLNPCVGASPAGTIELQRLRSHSQPSVRESLPVPGPFDSWFEVDVFLRIADRQYRVIPQFEIAGYHIDLVVEGMQGRMAVECDGDSWHGPERYHEDMARQRQLERCGWTFWRVRGSVYFRDPDKAMEGLWQQLDRLGIQPTPDSPVSSSASQGMQSIQTVGNTPGESCAGLDPAQEIGRSSTSIKDHPPERNVPAEDSQIEDTPVRLSSVVPPTVPEINNTIARDGRANPTANPPQLRRITFEYEVKGTFLAFASHPIEVPGSRIKDLQEAGLASGQEVRIVTIDGKQYDGAIGITGTGNYRSYEIRVSCSLSDNYCGSASIGDTIAVAIEVNQGTPTVHLSASPVNRRTVNRRFR